MSMYLVTVLELRVSKFLRKNKDILRKNRKYTCARSPYYTDLPLKESKSLLRILGIIHGDGNMSGNRILISENDINFVKKISLLFKRNFGLKPNIFHDKKRNSYYCHIKNSILYRYLTNVLEVPKGAIRPNLKLPIFVKKLGFKFQKSYIGGLYDAEGWISTRQAHIGFSIINKEIRDFISNILKKCKIKHSISLRNRRKNIEYELHIYGKYNLKEFQRQISFQHPLKINKISTFY